MNCICLFPGFGEPLMDPIKLPEFTTLEKRKQHSGIAELVRKIHHTDVLWAEKYVSKTPFYSMFWIVRRLKRVIRENAKYAHGTMLDVGCGLKPHARVFAPYIDKHVGLDYSPVSGYRGNCADVCGDAAALPFADGCFDTVLCSEVLVDLPDPEKTIAEFERVLADNGTLITTAAFVHPVHDRNDYFRYPPDGLAVIMRRHGLTVERVVPTSGTAVTLAAMINLYWYDCHFLWNKWLYPIGLVLRPLLWLLCFIINMIGGLFELILPDKLLSFSHLTVARKCPAADLTVGK